MTTKFGFLKAFVLSIGVDHTTLKLKSLCLGFGAKEIVNHLREFLFPGAFAQSDPCLSQPVMRSILMWHPFCSVTRLMWRICRHLETSGEFMPSQLPSCERKNRPNDFSFDASNHANKVLTFKQANCKVVMIMTVSAPFDKVFTHKGVKSSKQDDKW